MHLSIEGLSQVTAHACILLEASLRHEKLRVALPVPHARPGHIWLGKELAPAMMLPHIMVILAVLSGMCSWDAAGCQDGERCKEHSCLLAAILWIWYHPGDHLDI